MAYGDERYIGISDWSNTIRSFDAARLRFESELLWVDVFTGRVVIPRDDHFNIPNDYDWFSGLYGSTRTLLPWQETEFFLLSRNVGEGSPAAIASGIGGPTSRDIYTLGTRWKSSPAKLGNWDYTFEAAGQLGGIGRGPTRLDHQAFGINGTGGYTFKDVFGSPRFTFGYDFGSGDPDPSDGKNETLELLFGTNHPFYGLADLFSMRNMHIPRTGASFKPRKDVVISGEWLGFWMADTSDFLYPESGAGREGNGYGRNPAFHSQVANEMDLNATWRFATWGQVQSGYAHVFAGQYLKASAAAGGRPVEDADWGYISFSLSF